MTNSREKFEAFISGPPYELEVARFGDTSAWPGNYKDIGVDLAWQAFGAGRKSMRDEVLPIIFGQCESDNVAQRTVNAIKEIQP